MESTPMIRAQREKILVYLVYLTVLLAFLLFYYHTPAEIGRGIPNILQTPSRLRLTPRNVSPKTGLHGGRTSLFRVQSRRKNSPGLTFRLASWGHSVEPCVGCSLQKTPSSPLSTMWILDLLRLVFWACMLTSFSRGVPLTTLDTYPPKPWRSGLLEWMHEWPDIADKGHDEYS